MSQLLPLAQLASMDVAALREQVSLRRALLDRLFLLLRNAASPATFLWVLKSHAATLEERGLWDEAARLTALATAVHADVSRLLSEAASLEAQQQQLMDGEAPPAVAASK